MTGGRSFAVLVRIALALAAAFTPLAARCADRVSVISAVFVERASVDSSGRQRLTLNRPRQVARGDDLVVVLTARNQGDTPAPRVELTAAVPNAVRFNEVLAVRTLTVSVDGGQHWGALDTLTVRKAAGGPRPARPSDVTHLRWRLPRPLPPGEATTIMFRGAVR